MRKVGNGDGGSMSSVDGAQSRGDAGAAPDFGFFVPDVPPPRDVSFPDIVIPDVAPPVCGNKLLEATEVCDDGNLTAGDGCSATCTVEVDHVCPIAGQPCVRNVLCGDRKQTGGEACDDGNVAAGDGCSPTCTVEPGYACARGTACRPHCGDGVIIAPEQCDDGNAAAGDGCGPNCVVESTEGDGWLCPRAGQPCQRTVCGDGAIQGSEQCDDANSDTGDGCSPFCRREPACPPAGGPCTTVCGDGLLLPIDATTGQECDDGNTIPGDGCSIDCKLEKGYACPPSQVMQDPLRLPIIYRDFKGAGEAGGHPDFEAMIVTESGIVQDRLSSTGKPVHVAADKMSTANHNAGGSGFDYFGVWYKDDPAYNKTVRDYLSFNRQASGAYQYTNNDFFPLDNRGWGNYMGREVGGRYRNFHFTSELRYWFEYRGNEQLDFTGDDDVWVFINKRLVVDLGGVHPALNASLIMDGSSGMARVCDVLSPCMSRRQVDLGLVRGNVYEIVVFQAERHTTLSNYRLTLSNFSGVRSACKTVCGDGILTRDEACDLGTAGNTGAYGTCNSDCTLPPGCGDGVVNGSEMCDDGVNAAPYSGGATRLCGPGCVWAGSCGDGVKNGPEQCDQGTANHPAAYGKDRCTTSCTAAPYCGDGIVQSGFGEECDSSALCNAQCKRADDIR